jgi:uroporphyrinogen decarboxylase
VIHPKWARIDAAIEGRKPDRIPFGVWHHLPKVDGEAATLAAATVDFYRRYDPDWIKVMFRNSFGIEDWGAKVTGYHPTRGNFTVVDPAIKEPEDWYALEVKPPDAGFAGVQLEALRLVRAAIGDEAPIVATIFAPTMIASRLAGNVVFTRHLKEAPQAVRAGLDTIAKTVADFGVACLENGASGIFYSIIHASRRMFTDATYAELDRDFDRPTAQTLFDRTRFMMAHLHGHELMFERFAEYPANILNWYDREGGPFLDRARTVIPNTAFAGGIDHRGTLMLGTADDIRSEILDAIAQTGGMRILLAPGCAIPITVPPASLEAVRETVASL